MYQNYPHWAQQLAEKYFSKTVNQFLLHGNVHDMVRYQIDGNYHFKTLREFLSSELFGARDVVIYFDRAGGIQFRDTDSHQDFSRAVSGYDSYSGTEYAKKVPKDPVRAFSLLENYFRIRLAEGKSIACIIDYAETIVPMSDYSATSSEDRNALVALQKWARDQLFLSSDFTVCLLSENLNDLNKNLVQSPYNAELKLELPNEDGRLSFINRFFQKKEVDAVTEVDLNVLAQQTAGLSYVNLDSLLSGAAENNRIITFKELSATKKALIEAEAYGLLEFVETRYNLDIVAGHTKVKEHLREAAFALKNGRNDVMPMGYLVCGPVGTGKTFLVTCFANEIGIPMVKLRNFRSQWQGVTEGNLEKILTLLKAMSPVAVIIDEADAYLGDRNSSGDSGVSSRVFAQIAQFMSNTEHRGRIVWFLMTARPDLMPVDLKRQGRAEEHLALFYPIDEKERIELFQAMKNKTAINLENNEVPASIKKGNYRLSGADMEAALTRAKFKAATKGLAVVTTDILEEVLTDFIPPVYPDEIELQILAAVSECTSKAMLPEPYRNMNKSEVNAKIEELKLTVR